MDIKESSTPDQRPLYKNREISARATYVSRWPPLHLVVRVYLNSCLDAAEVGVILDVMAALTGKRGNR